jgi:uncharacterized protein YgiM (DUF1202 family)
MSWLKIFALSLTAAALQAAPQQPVNVKTQIAGKKAESFKPFTGKVLANKVRVRTQPDLDSHIFRQVDKNELLLVVGEDSDFYAVQPPKNTKAYIFRSYILDHVIEANRVNVRLEPHADGPIIGQMQAGDKVVGQPCALNHKWFEISPPSSTRFYVSKEFIVNAGGPDYMATMEKRKKQVGDLLNTAFLSAEAECKKSYEDMSPQPIIEQFQTVVKNYSEFTEPVQQAKEALALLKDTYLHKKIAYLESKAQLSPMVKDELIARHKAESQELFANTTTAPNKELFAKRNGRKDATDKMCFWDTMEESLFLSWTAFHTGRKMDDFYAEQKANAIVLTGRVKRYDHPVKNRPGDYILQGNDSPLAYLYSTQVNLDKYEEKEVSILVSPRPNNHFAFPAYFVLNIE